MTRLLLVLFCLAAALPISAEPLPADLVDGTLFAYQKQLGAGQARNGAREKEMPISSEPRESHTLPPGCV